MVNTVGSLKSDDNHPKVSIRAGSGEALPMNQQVEQGYRMHRVLSNLNQIGRASCRERV